MEKIIDFLESTKMTIAGGIALFLSLLFKPLNFLAWITVLISGIPIIYSAIKKVIKNRGISKISSALLISVAMIAAILIGDLFAAGEVAFIMAIGEILEHKTTHKAKRGLKNLLSLAPQNARLICGNEEKIILARDIKTDDFLRVLPGETIPADAVIIKGETSVDQRAVTGESIPADKRIGDKVFGGTINSFGAIDIKAIKPYDESSISVLIRMVKDAEGKKAPMQRTADKWASILVPIALLIAIITYFATRDITRAVTVLVVFCPCALVLATPTAIMAAIGQASKHGVIIKSGEALEKMGKVDAITFDKTGTLTYGKLTVSDIITAPDISENEVIEYAKTAEKKSTHPLALAITEYKKDITAKEPDSFKMLSGRGVLALVSDDTILCGNEGFLLDENVSISQNLIKQAHALKEQGKALVFVAKNKDCIGVIALSDILKNDAKSVIDELLKLKVTPFMLSGDNEQTASFFALKTGIKNVLANLLPEDKVNHILALKKKGKTVCMIGDGVNDAPSLKVADVGISMASLGSDIAIDASDIALMHDDITKIPYLKRLAEGMVKTIKLSIFLSLAINLLAIVLSFFGILNPTTGALVHNAGSVFVVLLAALLYDRRF